MESFKSILETEKELQELHIEKNKEAIILMALIKFGEFITSVSGKIGGTINSRGKGGAYAKNFAMPSNPRTTYQINQRNIFTTQSQNWRSLTAVQRAAWIAAAVNFPYVNAVGDTKFLSGNALYNKLNINLTLTGTAIIPSPPSPSGVAAVLSIVPTYVAGVITIAFTPTPVPANTSFALWATPGLSPGINNVNNKLRLIHVYPTTTAAPLLPIVFYTSRLGSAAVGSKVTFGLMPINTVTGEAGLRLLASTIVA